MENKDDTRPRPNYYSELDVLGKIEFLKQELLRTQNQLKELVDFVRGFRNHKHLEGQIVVPLSHTQECEQSISFYFRVGSFE